MHIIDWIILAGLFCVLISIGYICKHLIKSVADFLVAGRSVGRYLGLGSGSLVGFGAVSTLAVWQMSYKSGLVGNWFWSLQFPLAIFLALTGFAVFRFRQTRAMTIPEMLEMRYGKGLRVFSGILIFVSGVINMGVFPAIGARFFVYFCGLPPEIILFGYQVHTFIPIMLIIVASSVFMCFLGGQVTLIVTDFFQNVFVNLLLLTIVIVVYKTMTWGHFTDVYAFVPEGESLVVPFSGGDSDFSPKFYLFQLFWMVYLCITWAPDTMQVSSAKDAKEAKLMRSMVSFRVLAGMLLGLFVVPLAAFVIMNHPDFSDLASNANMALSNISNPHVRSQMVVPAAISQILPVGVVGAFAAMMLFAFISTNDTFMLAWAGVLIQDVIIPLRGKKFEPKNHLRLLRFSVVAVAAIIIIFSLFFKISDNIFMFMCLSGSIYTAGAGVVILGGLYWARPTKLAAWITMLTGTVLSAAGFIYRYKINPDFPLDGYDIGFWVSILCIVLYFSLSLLNKSSNFNLNSMLNRDAAKPQHQSKFAFLNLRQWTSGLSGTDKLLFWFMILFTLVYVGLATLIIIVHLAIGLPLEFWLSFWKYYLYSMFFFGTFFFIWITIGGFRDLHKMFKTLREEKTDVSDDGTVVKVEDDK